MKTKLLYVGLVVVLLLLTLALITDAAPNAAPAASAAPAATTRPVKEVDPTLAAFVKPVAIADGDDALRQKMKQRRNTAARLLEVRIESYRKGLADVSGIFEAGKEVAEADRDLAQSAEEREAAATRFVDVLRVGERRLEEQFKAGVAPEANLLRARLARETAEVDLLKLQKNK